MPDLIAPPTARSPLEAVELVAIAVSDGDLEAAVAQYERAATLRPWTADEAPRAVREGLREGLRELMELRLPVDIGDCMVLPSTGVALVVAVRLIRGTGPNRERVSLCGRGSTVVRRQRGGSWRIAADAWRLARSVGGATR